MGGDRRRSPEGDRKALWKHGNDQYGSADKSEYLKKQHIIASRGFRACGRESGALRSPPTPLRSAHPCFLVFIVAGDFASAEATKGHENRRMSAVALWKPSAPPLLGLIHLDDNRSVSWRKPNCPPSAPQSFPHAAAPDSQTAPPAPGTAARRPSAPQTG